VFIRRLRLATGLILFTYLATHLVNHALGLVSLEAMEAGRQWFLALWRNPLGTTALYVALLTHFALALVTLYRRRHYRMPAWEATQILLGLAIPYLLVSHIVGTRVAHSWVGTEDRYAWVLLVLWHARPDLGAWQTLTVLIAWTHGCVGLHFWLRLRPGYPRAVPVLLAGAVLLPTLALVGFVVGGREATARALATGGVAAIARDVGAPTPPERAALDVTARSIEVGIALSLAGVMLARTIRRARERRGVYQVTYPGRVAAGEPGMTVLEVSRRAGIPHASVCGGRGRCSTCRVHVVRGLESAPPPSPGELRVLQRVAAPPRVRLACQLRPTRDVSVVPLLPADATVTDAHAQPVQHAGQEREVAILFADLRQFTRLAERRLPYDVVFLLNRYFEAVDAAVVAAGGVVNQFTGDGVMAIFGIETGLAEGCRAALAAAAGLVGSVETISRDLAGELDTALRIGIGIHAGGAVVGEMGSGRARYLTAVGDTVHVASRLQDLTKTYDCQLVVSAPTLAAAGIASGGLRCAEITVRNRTEPVAIYIVADVSELTAMTAGRTS
jgi:adenylate cyclase